MLCCHGNAQRGQLGFGALSFQSIVFIQLSKSKGCFLVDSASNDDIICTEKLVKAQNLNALLNKISEDEKTKKKR